jgi:large subunit ribosomal protein L23
MSIIIKPIITEKITKEGEVFNRFGFVVDKKQTKYKLRKLLKLLME